MSLEIHFSSALPSNSPFMDSSFLANKQATLRKTLEHSPHHFYRELHQGDSLTKCNELYQRLSAEASASALAPAKAHFVHIGIGGSALGPAMLISALGRLPPRGVRFTFIDNIDPDHTYDQLADIDPHRAVFFFVSKSGQTSETLANMILISSWLEKKGIPLEQFPKLAVVATNSEDGLLLNWAARFKLPVLPIPSGVGGRYSVLTEVGLFPALFAGIDAAALLAGARSFDPFAADAGPAPKDNPLFQVAAFLLDLKKREGIGQTVLMPYSSKLRAFSHWFVQLWAESLGKKENRQGSVVHEGLTPLAAYGTCDQHAQMQLFMEGPRDKCLIIIEVQEFHRDFALDSLNRLDSKEEEGEGRHHFPSGISLSQLMQAQLKGTLAALTCAQRPFIHLAIPKCDAFSLGQLIAFFECLTALMGDCLDIDPFNQPGVEAGKSYAKQWLSEQGLRTPGKIILK